jgi:hypothetical protein
MRHDWQPTGPRQEKCAACGATCSRGPDGKIILYEVTRKASTVGDVDPWEAEADRRLGAKVA